MIITKKALSRRTMLRGAGTVLALPVLDAMMPALSGAAATPPARLAFIYHPVGMIMDKWTPKTVGADFEFTTSMKALEAYRENLTVLTDDQLMVPANSAIALMASTIATQEAVFAVDNLINSLTTERLNQMLNLIINDGSDPEVVANAFVDTL